LERRHRQEMRKKEGLWLRRRYKLNWRIGSVKILKQSFKTDGKKKRSWIANIKLWKEEKKWGRRKDDNEAEKKEKTKAWFKDWIGEDFFNQKFKTERNKKITRIGNTKSREERKKY